MAPLNPRHKLRARQLSCNLLNERSRMELQTDTFYYSGLCNITYKRTNDIVTEVGT